MVAIEEIGDIAERFCDEFQLASPRYASDPLYWVVSFCLPRSVLSLNLDSHEFRFYVEVAATGKEPVLVSRLGIDFGRGLNAKRVYRLLDGTLPNGRPKAVRARFAAILNALGPHLVEIDDRVFALCQ